MFSLARAFKVRRTREIKGAPWEERVEGFWLTLFGEAEKVEGLRIIICFGDDGGDHEGCRVGCV